MNKRSREIVRKSIITLVMVLIVIGSLFPIYWMLLTSVQPRHELMNYPPNFYTKQPTLQYWQFTFREAIPEFINSLVVAIVPYFLMMRTLRLIDTHTAVIITHLIITIPFAVWMIKGFIQEVPRELEEAAMIDGCSQLDVIRIVTLPLIAPRLVVTALFCFIWSWNDFMFALILTRNKAITIPVAIAGMREAHGLMWGEVSATAALGTVPIIILAIFLQKYLVRGLSLGSLK